MLWRKKDKDLADWIDGDKNAMLVTGARQIGKTFLIRKVLERENCDYVEFNLIKQPEIIDLFETIINSNIDLFLARLTLLTKKELIKGKTIIFFDEIQEYKEVLTVIKFLVEEGSFKYILSGSLLGVEINNLRSAPVGYLTVIDMFPLDFEEFIKALNIKESTIGLLKKSFNERIPVDDFIHKKMLDTFYTYLVVGGMPEAVVTYILENEFSKVAKIQSNIEKMYKVDFSKYEVEKKYKLKKTYELIPSELAEKNKRYIFTNLDPELRFDKYENNFNWLIDSGVAISVFNTTEPVLPLKINKKNNLFKLFLADCGMLTNMYGRATQLKLLNQGVGMNCGAIFENAVAQELNSHGYQCYYYNNKKLGELDFIIEYNGRVLPIEVKSGKDYTVHSALNNVIKNFKVEEAMVLSSANVYLKDKIIYFPIYFIMFINEDNLIIKKEKLDLSDL